MRPGADIAALGRHETALLYIFLRRRLHEEHGPVFIAVVEVTIRVEDGTLAGRAFLPLHFAALQLDAEELARIAVAVDVAVDEDDAAVHILHGLVEIRFFESKPIALA